MVILFILFCWRCCLFHLFVDFSPFSAGCDNYSQICPWVCWFFFNSPVCCLLLSFVAEWSRKQISLFPTEYVNTVCMYQPDLNINQAHTSWTSPQGEYPMRTENLLYRSKHSVYIPLFLPKIAIFFSFVCLLLARNLQGLQRAKPSAFLISCLVYYWNIIHQPTQPNWLFGRWTQQWLSGWCHCFSHVFLLNTVGKTRDRFPVWETFNHQIFQTRSSAEG